ncbi:MAG: hypothetical protein JW973_13475 [Bacteroidales bacterium]|nr:hypothetical protein [Bacteroidales bacterium]
MKKALLLILAIGYCIAGTAGLRYNSWVISENGKMNCKQVHVGISKVRIELNDGNKIVLPIEQINSYSVDGKVFKKLVLYSHGTPTNKTVFMEQLRTRNGFSLYKYYRCDIESPHDCYYIYEGDTFCFALDESMETKKLKNLFKYFGYKAVLA